VWGVKQLLLICAVVMGQSVLAADEEPLIADPIVEKEIRKSLKKSEGELTKADLAKVTQFSLAYTKITDAGLKELAKMQNLTQLYLQATQITDAGLKEVAEATRFVRRSDATIRRWIKLGILPANKPGVVDPENRGGKWNIRQADLIQVAGNGGGSI